MGGVYVLLIFETLQVMILVDGGLVLIFLWKLAENCVDT